MYVHGYVLCISCILAFLYYLMPLWFQMMHIVVEMPHYCMRFLQKIYKKPSTLTSRCVLWLVRKINKLHTLLTSYVFVWYVVMFCTLYWHDITNCCNCSPCDFLPIEPRAVLHTSVETRPGCQLNFFLFFFHEVHNFVLLPYINCNNK